MNIYLKRFALVFIIAILTTLGNCQTPDDDEVDINIPNYPHKIYSGRFSSIKVSS